MAPSPLLNLPVDILVLIFPYLDAASFLHLTATCHALHHPDFTDDARYWAQLARRSSRVPNRPVVQNDGRHWRRLCKRLLTQSQIYTWGSNEKGCLSHAGPSSAELVGARTGLGGRHPFHVHNSSSWPEPMQRVAGLGPVADLQCGGWSTTLLSAKGALYSVGVLDGIRAQRVKTEPVPLAFPPGFPAPWDRYDPATAIAAFSAGRQHLLALSDSGRIWAWGDIEAPALHVRFLLHDTVETGGGKARGVVQSVVAGWNKSAALIRGTGIVLWEPLRREPGETEFEDTVLVLDSVVVPKTGYVATSKPESKSDKSRADAIGEVANFIVLEDLVLFNTDLGKVFAAEVFWTDDDRRVAEPVELLRSQPAEPDDAFITDVQGSFRSFAVFTRSGAVLTSQQDRVKAFLHRPSDPNTPPPSLFTRIPALQHKAVIQVAFGDYHFHALHAPGYITSYGVEPQGCGAFGLGGDGDAEASLRGIRYRGNSGDRVLVPHAAAADGRRVWFAREKRSWCTFLASGAADPAESMARQRMAFATPDLRCHGEVSEWIEQAARDWEVKYGVSPAGNESHDGDDDNDDNDDDDGLGAYFALGVAAAGWHSGALVLVNEARAERLKRACEMPDPEFKVADAAANSASATPSPSSSTSFVSRAASLGRWFLGLPGEGEPPLPHPRNLHLAAFQRNRHPVAYGAAPRVGARYVWADDHFPRLVLSDGTEMPGTVPFDEWPLGRPEWRFEEMDGGT